MKAMAKHRTHSIEFKRQVAQDFIAGETLHGLKPGRNSPMISTRVRARRNCPIPRSPFAVSARLCVQEGPHTKAQPTFVK
jgi:hypothetical protein